MSMDTKEIPVENTRDRCLSYAASLSFLLSGSGRRKRIVIHAHLTKDVESDAREIYLRSVEQCRGKMFELNLTGSHDNMLSSSVHRNVLTPISAGDLKLRSEKLVEVWLLDRARND